MNNHIRMTLITDLKVLYDMVQVKFTSYKFAQTPCCYCWRQKIKKYKVRMP